MQAMMIMAVQFPLLYNPGHREIVGQLLCPNPMKMPPKPTTNQTVFFSPDL
jgi:hypothetical protein